MSTGTLKTLSLDLNKYSAKATVHNILATFDLPTKYVDALPERSTKTDREIKWHRSYYDATGQIDPQRELYTGQKKEKL